MYDTLIADSRRFIAALARNNTRDWFAANRAAYDTKMKAPAEALLAELAPRLSDLTGHRVGQKLFRIHRDVRFSRDKRPYKEHLHVMWPIEAGARQDPVFFFGIGQDYVTAGAGVMAMDKSVLADWRKLADGDADWLRAPIVAAQAKGYALRDPELKRVPPPYGQDHPAGDLLRMKALVMTGELGADAALPRDLLAAFEDLWPMADRFLSVAEAPAL